MPKLDALQTAERLQKQLDRLRLGEEVAVRDLRALLTEQQRNELDTAWLEQQQLRKQKRARTDVEQRALGWKTKREIQIHVVQVALAEIEKNELSVLESKLADKEVRQAKIFLREFSTARKNGKDYRSACLWANNELVRSGLKRIDGQETRGLSKRDKEVREMEERILTRIRNDKEKE